jgi:two-component system, NtrC family, sensor histidine kinase HydH
MMLRLGSLRTRLVLAFMLVSVPPMLVAAYVTARIVSDAFDQNVEQWLGDTTRFFKLEVGEAQSDASNIAKLVAKRLSESGVMSQPGTPAFDFDFFTSLGYDLIVVYDDAKRIRYTSKSFDQLSSMPTETINSVFDVSMSGRHTLMAGSVEPIHSGDETFYVLVATWIDPDFLHSIKVVTSLELRLFYRDGDTLKPILARAGDEAPSTAPGPELVRRLTEQDPVYIDSDDYYAAAYAALVDSSGEVVGAIFCGLGTQESLFAQIGGLGLFVSMFLAGALLSTLAGLFISARLVRPLKALSKGVRSVTAGDYQQRVAEAGGAEVEELARSFNVMAAELNKVHELEAELRRRDRLTALGEAAMVIAHEVRNPLGVIQTSAEVVRSKAHLTQADDRLLGYVIDEVRRIEGLIREFLDFARPKEPRRDPVLLRDVLNRVRAFMEPEFQRRRISFAIEDNVPQATVLGDEDQLYQACLNLVLNSIDALSDGGQITGTVSQHADGFAVTISDTGSGVPDQVVQRLFDPFFTTKVRGSGLGLTKVQTVAEAHGGRAEYRPRPGGGAIFQIVLPAAASVSLALTDPIS